MWENRSRDGIKGSGEDCYFNVEITNQRACNIYVRNSLGWLETRLAKIILNYLYIAYLRYVAGVGRGPAARSEVPRRLRHRPSWEGERDSAHRTANGQRRASRAALSASNTDNHMLSFMCGTTFRCRVASPLHRWGP